MGQALVPTQSVHIQAPVGRHGNYGKWVEKVDRCHARPLLASITQGNRKQSLLLGTSIREDSVKGLLESWY